jgi:hypothetical protein
MKQVPPVMKFAAGCLVLLCGCTKPVPDGAYRVGVEKSISQPTSMVREYVVETTSLRRIMLAEPGGTNSVTIAPDIMTKERTGKGRATITGELQGTGEDTRVTVTMKVETKGSIARAEEVLAVPGVDDLSSIFTETEATGDLTSATTLLRLTSGNRYLQIVIE